MTRGMVALVDDEDYLELNRHQWYAKPKRNNCYAIRDIGRRKNRIIVGMHNQILGIKGVDHKNTNGLDNQRDNLRPANNSQNQWNSRPHKGRRFKGVFKSSLGNNWYSRIQIKLNRIYIGTYQTEEEAAHAYDTKAKELFGEYARLNFPNSKKIEVDNSNYFGPRSCG